MITVWESTSPSEFNDLRRSRTSCDDVDSAGEDERERRAAIPAAPVKGPCGDIRPALCWQVVAYVTYLVASASCLRVYMCHCDCRVLYGRYCRTRSR